MKEDSSREPVERLQSDDVQPSHNGQEAEVSPPVKLGPSAKRKRITPTIEMMHAIAAERGGHFRSTNYVNNRTDLDWTGSAHRDISGRQVFRTSDKELGAVLVSMTADVIHSRIYRQ